MTRYSLLACMLAIATACSDTPPIYRNTNPELAAARTPQQKDALILRKDSLLAVKERQLSLQSQLIGDAATSARLVSEINSDLSKARILVKEDTARSESAIQNASDELVMVQKKVRVVLDRLAAGEAHVRRLRADSVARTMVNATQAAQIADYERSMADLRTTVENQNRELVALTARVDAMAQENLALVARTEAMAKHEDSVFVVIGTEKELTARGIIRREGGTLLAFGRGKMIVPARAFDRSDFQVLSKAQDLTIPLPEGDREYRVVSRQNLAFTDSANPREPLVKGALHVTDPEQFWAPSRFLILVQR